MSEFVEGVSLLSTKKSLKEDYKYRQEWLKKKGQAAEADVVMSGVDTEVLMASYVDDNTSQGKR